TVKRTADVVGEILSIESAGNSADQGSAVVDVNVDGAVGVGAVPGPAFDSVAALTVVTTEEIRSLRAVNSSCGVGEESVGAGELDVDGVNVAGLHGSWG